MRGLIVAIGLLSFTASAATKPKHKVSERKRDSRRAKHPNRVAHAEPERLERRGAGRASLRSASRTSPPVHTGRELIRGPIRGQSIGAPWAGRLRDPVELADGDGYWIRRPGRAYGTRTTVEFIERVVGDIVDRFPDIHAISIGDISAKDGGRISQHNSHQSGRDVDIGLIYKKQPDGFPESFVVGTADNLDLEATFVLVEEFAKTANESGGAQMIFLDFNVQGLLYEWARENGEAEDHLAWLFQYPNGRGASAGIVRHEPNHRDHIHVRFRCPAADTACR
jgi:hypothetical protein